MCEGRNGTVEHWSHKIRGTCNEEATGYFGIRTVGRPGPREPSF